MTAAEGPGEGPEGPGEGPEDPVSGHAEQVEPLPASDASAIWVDPADPLAAPGPLGVEAGPGPGAPLIKTDAGAAAFFDLDNTVMQGASMFHLAKGLYHREFFPTRVILKGSWLQVYFRMVGRENPSTSQTARSRHPVVHRRADRRRAGGDRRRDLRGVDRGPDLAGHPGDRPDAPRRRSAVWLVTAAPVEMAGIIAAGWA